MLKIKRSERLVIKELREEIPSFECIPGCTDCCGPIVFSKWEWSQVKEKKEAESIDCPYSLQSKCEIYDDRPILCRIYGTVEDLLCPHGKRPPTLLTKEQGKDIMRRYTKFT